jgi:hypothetical protein
MDLELVDELVARNAITFVAGDDDQNRHFDSLKSSITNGTHPVYIVHTPVYKVSLADWNLVLRGTGLAGYFP